MATVRRLDDVEIRSELCGERKKFAASLSRQLRLQGDRRVHSLFARDPLDLAFNGRSWYAFNSFVLGDSVWQPKIESTAIRFAIFNGNALDAHALENLKPEEEPDALRSQQMLNSGVQFFKRFIVFVFLHHHDKIAMECLDAFERFLHVQDKGLPTLIKAALAHVQFEIPRIPGSGVIAPKPQVTDTS